MAVDYYCKCKDCCWVDPTTRSGYKWYCESFGCFVDPDVVRECKRHRAR